MVPGIKTIVVAGTSLREGTRYLSANEMVLHDPEDIFIRNK